MAQHEPDAPQPKGGGPPDAHLFCPDGRDRLAFHVPAW